MVSRTCLQESRVPRSNAMTISNWAQDKGHYYSQPTQCIVIFGKSLKNCHRFVLLDSPPKWVSFNDPCEEYIFLVVWVCLRIFRWLWQQAASKACFWAPGFSGPTSITSITMGPSFTFVVWWGWPGVTWWRLHPLMFQNHLKRQPATKRDFDWKKLKPQKRIIYIYI